MFSILEIILIDPLSVFSLLLKCVRIYIRIHTTTLTSSRRVKQIECLRHHCPNLTEIVNHTIYEIPLEILQYPHPLYLVVYVL
jgi:hypothetical protein